MLRVLSSKKDGFELVQWMKGRSGMTEKRIIALGTGMLLAILLVGFYAHTQLLFQVRESTYREEVESLFEKVRGEVSQLRSLPPPEGLRVEVVSIELFKSETRERLEESALLRAQEALYKGLLLVPEDFSLLENRIGQAGMTLAATSGKTLYVVKEYFDPTNRRQALRTLAHEYTHILQYVYIEQRAIQTEDELRAWTAFIEGEADLVADLYVAQVTGEEFSLRLPPIPASKPEGAGGSWALDQIFAFPYAYGENFVYQLFRKGGWEEVNRAYRHPPVSSAQILHPDRYLTGFEPDSLSNPEPIRIGWSIYFPERLGEYFIRVLLLQKISPFVAVDASSGWMGDNATLYLNHNTYLLFWRSMWKDEGSASAFEKALLAFFKEVGGGGRDRLLWDFNGRRIAVKRIDKEVMLIGSSDLQVLMEEVESKFRETSSST